MQVPIKPILAGGYSILQGNRTLRQPATSVRLFSLFSHRPESRASNIYKQLLVAGNLNIYEAYYENCRYSYILEYFLKTKDSLAMLHQLKQYDTADIGIFKEYAHIKNVESDKDKDFYVWPTH